MYRIIRFTWLVGLITLVLFLSSSCKKSASSSTQDIPTKEEEPDGLKEFYEHRIYQMANDEQHARTVQFIENALLPAYHRAGVKTVGAFEMVEPEENGYQIHLLICLSEPNAFAKLYDELYKDEEFLRAGADHLDQSDPDEKNFERINSKLLVAFDSMPSLEIPPVEATDRVFELRSYESFSELKGRKKVAMFDEGGEVTIFKDLGFQPVFFAEALSGDELPNLVYMITFDNLEERDDYWKSFGDDPRWKAIKDLPEYANTVSKIHSMILKPLQGSDIR